MADRQGLYYIQHTTLYSKRVMCYSCTMIPSEYLSGYRGALQRTAWLEGHIARDTVNIPITDTGRIIAGAMLVDISSSFHIGDFCKSSLSSWEQPIRGLRCTNAAAPLSHSASIALKTALCPYFRYLTAFLVDTWQIGDVKFLLELVAR